MNETKVIVVGGGYGGITAAKALDEVADVVLVEPRATFVHNLAALRAVVDPAWVDRIFIPYDGLLRNGSVIRDRAVRVTENAVELGSGLVLHADYIVLATGSSYPFPAKPQPAQRHRLREVHQELVKADRVLLLGAGPVGIEFAGEIKSAWPDKKVILADRKETLLPGKFPDEFIPELHRQLVEIGIELRLGVTFNGLPEPGVYAPFGEADIWFQCYGAAPVTDYLGGKLAHARRADGLIEVTPQLRVADVPNVFAIGDVTGVPDRKMARLAQRHAESVAAGIRALITGEGEVETYVNDGDAIVLPVGPRGGVTYSPEVGFLGADMTAEIKEKFYLDQYLELLGA
jgi:NADH dehydrogenase FAD-containing subunit